ncbi:MULTISPECIES: FAD-binding domain-containing protein [Spirulina sp. CCY15215]|uniref:FAD-binding domain-containing protein n=1 Tax=Spirulina sp. CCY15215 TaxID=2767591 RepID=UPI001951DAA8|nr:FAD-binding domain-containing protein [Spirulina major]
MCILFWHRCDLRVEDNLGLSAARESSAKIIGVFCLDPNILKRDDIAPARVAYMLGCLQELQISYQQLGSQLLILYDEPDRAIPKLASALNCQQIFWTLDIEPYARERDRRLQQILEDRSIEVKTYWDKLLHEPGTIQTGAEKPYTVYTPFWKNWLKQKKYEPCQPLERLLGLTEAEEIAARAAGAIALPTAQDLGYPWENGFILEPGEKAAKERLEEFCNSVLYEYQEQRNFPAIDGTSRLSAALKFGAIGIRTIWQTAQIAYENCRSDEARKNVQTWQQELAWREFYHHALYFFPELAEGAYRETFKHFPWENNEEYFQAWCEGKTGYPIVDAAMRQLNETGWMHNRCRMIVANFLTKDLIIDWRWGEKYFMQKLCDGDLAANNGGWQWSASSGMDPKPLRIFNPASQSKKFDSEGEYIRQWVNELRSFDPEYLVTGKIPSLELQYCGYPAPIVDHNQQQRKFKALYKYIKEENGKV